MIDVKLDIKPIPVPLKYQPVYKIIMLLAILKYGSPKPYSATFLKLHLFMWALRTAENQAILLEIKNKIRDSIVPWIFEPAMDTIVTLAIINGLCKREIKGGELQVELLDDGHKLLSKIEDMDLFSEDMSKIRAIGKVPQNTIAAANKKWELY